MTEAFHKETSCDYAKKDVLSGTGAKIEAIHLADVLQRQRSIAKEDSGNHTSNPQL